jgi:hypothetical protein
VVNVSIHPLVDAAVVAEQIRRHALAIVTVAATTASLADAKVTGADLDMSEAKTR